MKIIAQNSDNEFVIRVDEYPRHLRMVVAHNYVQFSGSFGLWTDFKTFGHKSLTGPLAWTSNVISVPHNVQIPIRLMQKAVMPLLSAHKYMQPEHIAMRDKGVWGGKPEDKGVMYHPYSYYDQAIQYYDAATDTQMVAFIMTGDAVANHVTKAFYDKYIAPNKK